MNTSREQVQELGHTKTAKRKPTKRHVARESKKIHKRTKNVLDFFSPTPYTTNITPTMEFNMNKRQYKKLLAKRATNTQPKPSLSAPLLVAAYSKDKLLAIASERNVTARKSWNKTKIANAITANQ